MPTGKIKKVVSDRGFGFIVPDEGGDDVFFHVSGLVDQAKLEDFSEGDNVLYDTVSKNGRTRAVEVCLRGR